MKQITTITFIVCLIATPLMAGSHSADSVHEIRIDLESLWKTGPEFIVSDIGIVPAGEYNGDSVVIIFISEDLRTCGASLDWSFDSDDLTDHFGRIVQFIVRKPLSLIDLEGSALYPSWPEWTIHPYEGPYNPGDLFYAEAFVDTEAEGSGYTTEFFCKRMGSL